MFFMALELRIFIDIYITCGNNVTIAFCFCSSFLSIFITSQLCYLLVPCGYIFYDVRTTLYFGMFELRMEVTLQLRFAFVCHRDVFFITS